jgi:Fe-S cluster assembly ATP-binding protein
MSTPFLEITNLHVDVDGKKILHGVDLIIDSGKTHALLGPNGCGKSTLLFTILGYPQYNITEGKIYFKGKDITDWSIYKRAKEGIALSFQKPPTIQGVKLGNLLKKYKNHDSSLAESLNMDGFLDRDINSGFSGGEIKRSELLQIMAMDADFLMLDEPDSGVDVENLRLLGKKLNQYLKGRSALIITHQGHILNYIDVDEAHMMLDGKIVCDGEPNEMLSTIINDGYAKCAQCVYRDKNNLRLRR